MKIKCRNCRLEKTQRAFPKGNYDDCNKSIKLLYKFHLEGINYYSKLLKNNYTEYMEISKKIHEFLRQRDLMLSVQECDYLAKEINDIYIKKWDETQKYCEKCAKMYGNYGEDIIKKLLEYYYEQRKYKDSPFDVVVEEFCEIEQIRLPYNPYE